VRTPGGDTVRAAQLLRQPATKLADLWQQRIVALDTTPQTERLDLASVETAVRRQLQEVGRARRDERRRIPDTVRFDDIPGLSNEVVQRLNEVRPTTLGQALRISGLTPAAVAVVSGYVRARRSGDKAVGR
jgi:tRNA uridine 5-carboxymethylaminomethyl modification enzyme